MTPVLVAVLLFLGAGAIPLTARTPIADVGASTRSEVDEVLFGVLERSGLRQLVTRPGPAWGGAGVAGSLLGFVAAQKPGLVLGLLTGLALPPLVVWMRGDRTESQLDASLPEFLESTSRSLRAGRSLMEATRQASLGQGLLADDLKALFLAVDRGLPFAESAESWAERRPYPSVRSVVTALSVGLATGADLSNSLDHVAAALRDRASLQGEISALASQARASAMVIGLAPLAFLGVASAGGSPPSELFGSPIGLLSLAVGLLLDLVGLIWMSRIIEGVR